MLSAKRRIPALSARGFWLCVAVLVVIRLFLTSFQMAYTWVGGAPLDDELMFRAANAVSAGDWLGAYDYLTLSKACSLPSGWRCSTRCTCPTWSPARHSGAAPRC